MAGDEAEPRDDDDLDEDEPPNIPPPDFDPAETPEQGTQD